MKLTSKLLIPVAFALASATAGASVLNLDYPTDQLRANGAIDATQGAMVGIGSALNVRNNESPVLAKNWGGTSSNQTDTMSKAEAGPVESGATQYFQ